MLWYVFPIEKGISWEGHLSGLFVGFLFSFLFKTKIEKPKIYKWEQEDYKEEDDAFMKHFDENGNFVPTPKEEKEEFTSTKYQNIKFQAPNTNSESTETILPKVKITYTFKKREE